MPPRKTAGENSKKAQGQARKAEAADAKKKGKEREVAAKEDQEWSKGAKDSSKKEAVAAKAAEAARKKAEKEALLKEEEATLVTKAKSGNAKSAQKKSRGTLDLSALDGPETTKIAPTINATGIDNALDALSITHESNETIDRHPERRFKAAYAQFEERRLDEMKDEKGLRRNQKIEQIRKEFEKHPDNPFNQVSGRFDSTKEELKSLKDEERKKVEARLVAGSSS